MQFEVVVIGTAVSGIRALQTLLWGIPADFKLPVVIVSHRRRDSEFGLCEFLRQHSRLPLREPEDKEEILPAHVYLAPRDYHLLIEERSFALSTDKPVTSARPSIDVLFESAADAYGRETIGVLLTGRNRDGIRGLMSIKSKGGLTVLADYERTDRAFAITEVDHVIPLSDTSSFLANLNTTTPVHYGT